MKTLIARANRLATLTALQKEIAILRAEAILRPDEVSLVIIENDDDMKAFEDECDRIEEERE